MIYNLFLLWQGLVVPVLRNVEGMNYVQIEQGLNELGEKVCMELHYNGSVRYVGLSSRSLFHVDISVKKFWHFDDIIK